MARKSRPKTTDTAGKSWPSGPWRDTFYIPMPEKFRPENPNKQLQILPENPAASNSRNGWKILAINYRYGRKIPASKNRYGRKILRPVTKETAGKSHNRWHRQFYAAVQWKSIWFVIWRSEVRAQPVLKSFCKTLPENSGGAENSAEISGTNGINFFCSMYESSLRHPVWVPATTSGQGTGN